MLGANMDMIDLSDNGKLVSTGPAIDSSRGQSLTSHHGSILAIVEARENYPKARTHQ